MSKLLAYAKANNRFAVAETTKKPLQCKNKDKSYCGSEGDCFKWVWEYVYKSGYGKIRNYYDAGDMKSDWARHFADFFNTKANADRWGLQRLPIDNPYDAPPGAIVVVPPGTPGTSHPTAGDIAVATGTDDFINDGPKMRYSRAYFANPKNKALGIYAPL